jgi:hypothetical protein
MRNDDKTFLIKSGTVLIKREGNGTYHWGKRCPMTDASPADYKPVSRVEAWRQGRRACRRCR